VPAPNEQLGIKSLGWTPANGDAEIQRLYAETTAFARRKVKWYVREAERAEKRSRIVRWLALPLWIAGIVCPLLPPASEALRSWGYVFLGLAGAIHAVDRVFFGYSSDVRRNTVTWLRIRKALAECEFALFEVKRADPAKRQDQDPLEILKKLRLDIETIVSAETSLWAVESSRRDENIDEQTSEKS
jgi:hypothetical protein